MAGFLLVAAVGVFACALLSLLGCVYIDNDRRLIGLGLIFGGIIIASGGLLWFVASA